jgi:hypothetical protein
MSPISPSPVVYGGKKARSKKARKTAKKGKQARKTAKKGKKSTKRKSFFARLFKL